MAHPNPGGTLPPHMKGFAPYALAALLVSLVGGFTVMLGPVFVQEMGLDDAATTWTALAQAISSAACAPILGRAGDMLGRRRTLLLGVAVYTAGNVLAALSSSLGRMLLARFVVGLGTAAIAPVVLSYIVTDFPADQQAKGFSLYMLLSSAAVVIGPTLSGLMIGAWGWRTMVWVCVGISAAVLVLCALLRDAHAPAPRPLTHFDAPGAVLVLIFFTLALCIPAVGQRQGWTSVALWTLVLAAIPALAALVWAEGRAVRPILPGCFIRRRAFVLSVLALFLTQGLMQANMTNIIVFIRQVQPENSVVSAYAISVMYLGMSLGSVAVGPLAGRHEPRRVLTGSFLLTALSCALFLLFTAEVSTLLLMGTLALLGFGLGGNAAILMKVALSELPADQAGAATGTYGLFRDLAAPFGVAVLVPMYTDRVASGMARGLTAGASAVEALHLLGLIECVSVAAGILVVRLLPRIHPERSRKSCG